MVQDAQGQKSKTQRLADRAAFWLTIIALTAGFGTFVVWLLLGRELSFALERMVTVMVICCPHALGLAIPLVAAISTSVSANGDDVSVTCQLFLYKLGLNGLSHSVQPNPVAGSTVNRLIRVLNDWRQLE